MEPNAYTRGEILIMATVATVVVVSSVAILRLFFRRLKDIERARWGAHAHPEDSELSFREAMGRIRSLSQGK